VSYKEGWVRDKGMQVLQFWSDAHRETSVDVFVTEPFNFDAEYASALLSPLNDSRIGLRSYRVLEYYERCSSTH
jgi:hypothetical protein